MSEKIQAWAVTYDIRGLNQWYTKTDLTLKEKDLVYSILFMNEKPEVYRNLSAPIELCPKSLLDEARDLAERGWGESIIDLPWEHPQQPREEEA